ncbi:MAG TPA: HAD hydrolase-like protein [Bryobacteraceae bacterium]|jgi:phosphoglycolate phosphatase-like HAD superfamily hydrolase
MQPIEAVLFEPVGCLAEFPPEPFQEIAAKLFRRRKQPSTSGSRAYWHLLNLMEAAGEADMAPALELQAVAEASLYEDVPPALIELKAMGVRPIVASSLSKVAISRFLEMNQLGGLFDRIFGRDDAGGIKTAPLQSALRNMRPDRAIYLTDAAEGLKVAKAVGVNAVLMMNDPDEARRLALRDPAGGIVSLHELPDFIRVVAAENAV